MLHHLIYTYNIQTPRLLLRLSAGVVALVAGLDHTCALLTGGGVDCWGYNDNGQLGTGGTFYTITPTGVMGLWAGE